MSNIYSEKMIEFLKENSIYKEYNPKNYIRKIVVHKELGRIDDSIKVTRAVKPSEKLINSYKKLKFERESSFGVVVCIKNTDEDYLRQMIESVLAQTYEKFTLYIIDYSDRAHAYIANVCTDYEDSRVVYRKLREGQSVCWDYFVCDYLVFINEMDALSPIALTECMKTIEEKNADLIYSDSAIFKKRKFNVLKRIFKPEFCPDNLESYDYIGDFFVLNKLSINPSDEFTFTNVSESSYSFLKKQVEFAKIICRIDKCLYLENIKKNYKLKLNKRNGIKEVPKVSIVIRSTDSLEKIARLINSILMMTTYPNYEIVVVESDTKTDNKLIYRYYKLISTHKNVRFIRWTKEDNICKIYNYAAKNIKSEYIIFVQDDIEISSYEWIEEMLAYASIDRIALVSPKIYKGKDEVYSCGVEYNFNKKYIFKNITEANLDFARNVSVASKQVFMIKKEKFDKMGGFNELYGQGCCVEDLSMRALKDGFYNVYTPYAVLNYHDKKSKYNLEAIKRFKEEWQSVFPIDKAKG